MASHPFMEPRVSFAERVAFLKPLWDAQRSLPGCVTRLHNPAYIPTRAVRTESPDLYPSLWQSDAGKALLLVTNLTDKPQTGTVEVDLGELEMTGKSAARVLPISGAFAGAKADGGAIRITNLPSLQFTAVLIE